MDKSRRFEDIKRTGCVPCLLENFLNSHAEIHHIVEQGYRQGDHRSYGNCQWHHKGIPWADLQADEMTGRLGPSLRLNSKAYHERYGSELDLLRTQDYILHLFATEPWGDFDMPRPIARKIREFWTNERNQPA